MAVSDEKNIERLKRIKEIMTLLADPLAAAELVNLLRKYGVEVHRAKEEFTIEKEKCPPASYIIRMDQPYSRCADMLLDIQYYNPTDPRPYDEDGH